MSLQNPAEITSSPQTKITRPASAPLESDEKKMRSSSEVILNTSPGNNLGSQLTCNSSTKSDDSPTKQHKIAQQPPRAQVQTPTVTLGPTLAETLGMGDARKFGSFVSNRQVGSGQYSDRVPVRLVFKNSQLKKYAEANLETHLVMALKHLTVHAFLYEVIQSLDLPPLREGTKFLILFSGQSSRFNISFEGSDLLVTVYKRICSIEDNREELKKSSSTDDLQASGNSGKTILVNEGQKVIMAELDMIRTQMSEGRHRNSEHGKRRKEKHDKGRPQPHHRSNSLKVKRGDDQGSDESFSCSIF